MNIPNFFSILRIISIPLFIIFLSYDKHSYALSIFCMAAVTDALDGFFARLFKQKTVLGSYLDPIADKLLLVSSFIALALLNLIPRWLAILVVSRDVIISLGILLLRLNLFQVEIKPSIVSKCTTFFQVLSIGITLLMQVLAKDFMWVRVVYQLTGLLTIASGIHYILMGMKIVNEKEDRRDV